MGYDGEGIKLSLVQNGASIADLFCGNEHGNMGTQTVILQMQVGDKVWIRNADSAGKRVYGGELYTTFSGFKLKWKQPIYVNSIVSVN